ncbi:MAG: family 43 glycosylhydrolase [Tannerellaceae bacterium]|jgi:hypothetical protein|nr:family 43 glycosylhydrolase [Tannerellaceae bacterium]
MFKNIEYHGKTVLLTGLMLLIAAYIVAEEVVIINGTDAGLQVTRFDTKGEAVDAHDGEIALFDGVYYLYGTSYDCGYQWGVEGAPFCGFKVYSSKDLMTWTDEGFLFDAQTEEWQRRCDGNTYGCYRPHVLYNKKNDNYVLWINSYDIGVGFHVFTGPTPVGPFTEVAEPWLAINSDLPAGLNNGDHDLFLDDDGTAYIAYTNWKAGGTIAIDKLNEDFTSGSGEFIAEAVHSKTEAPGLFKRGSKYYLFYSNPNCGYCGGTGTSYRTASTPLGQWVGETTVNVNGNSCSGQPSFVSVFEYENDTVYLYGSDRWNNGAKNEALANYYWAPLEFTPKGAVYPFECESRIPLPSIKKENTDIETPKDLDCTSGTENFTRYGDITGGIHRGQSFVATRSGILNGVSFCTHRYENSKVGLSIRIFNSTEDGLPTGDELSAHIVPVESIGWSPKLITVHPDIDVEKDKRYVIVVKAAGTGTYGFHYNDNSPYPGGGAIYSNNSGSSFRREANRTLMFQTFIGEKKSAGFNLNSDVDFDVYPNPMDKVLNISVNDINAGSEIKIYDTAGNKFISKRITDTSAQNITIDVSSLNSGVYIVKLDNDKVLKTIKMVKQ